jgi:hypothetical protein
MRGSILSSHRGNHQFHFPAMTMSDGTNTSRTSVASMNIATARPSDTSFIGSSLFVMKQMNVTIMIAAAVVMIGAVSAIA